MVSRAPQALIAGWQALLVAAVLALSACSTDVCAPDRAQPANGDAALYAYWTDNAFPLQLVDASGCPAEVVQQAVDVWSPHSGGFVISSGRFRAGKDREYAHVYLRTGEPDYCAASDSECAGHTNLKAYKVRDGAVPRAMYASITIKSCDVAVLAHELGHALGLDEAPRAGALMSPKGRAMDVSVGEADALAYECGPRAP